MERQRVQSSNILSIGYDVANMTLEVEFHGGRVYSYAPIPQSVYADLMRAESVGSYFSRHIRNAYPTERLR